eukprot:SAG11_NODE_3944_length_2138_cov_1.329573_2_plen_226_part_00
MAEVRHIQRCRALTAARDFIHGFAGAQVISIEAELQRRLDAQEQECSKSYLRAKEAWDMVMTMISENKANEHEIKRLKKDNESLSADIARLCEQLQASTSAKLWKGLGWKEQDERCADPEPELTADGHTMETEQLLLTLEVEVENWQKQIYELRAEWEQERLEVLAEKKALRDEASALRDANKRLQEQLSAHKAAAAAMERARTEDVENFRRVEQVRRAPWPPNF